MERKLAGRDFTGHDDGLMDWEGRMLERGSKEGSGGPGLGSGWLVYPAPLKGGWGLSNFRHIDFGGLAGHPCGNVQKPGLGRDLHCSLRLRP